jgi:hypothetical protein
LIVICGTIFLVFVGPIVRCEIIKTNPIHGLVKAPAGLGGRQTLLAAIKYEERLRHLSPQSRPLSIDPLDRGAVKVA